MWENYLKWLNTDRIIIFHEISNEVFEIYFCLSRVVKHFRKSTQIVTTNSKQDTSKIILETLLKWYVQTSKFKAIQLLKFPISPLQWWTLTDIYKCFPPIERHPEHPKTHRSLPKVPKIMSLPYVCNIPRKRAGITLSSIKHFYQLEVMFLLVIARRVQHTQNSQFLISLQCLKSERKESDFLHAHKMSNYSASWYH